MSGAQEYNEAPPPYSTTTPIVLALLSPLASLRNVCVSPPYLRDGVLRVREQARETDEDLTAKMAARDKV